MDWLTIVIVFFSVLGGIDYVIGNKLGIGEEFKKGISMMSPCVLAMSGMLILAPSISHILQGVVEYMPDFIDPSIISASLLANDMGGSALSQELCRNQEIGAFNGMVVSSMLGCTVSFTIPVALGLVDKKHHNELMLGILCGIVTIPVGCFVGGIVAALNIYLLIINLIPIAFFSGLIALALFKAPKKCIKVFSIFGAIINILIIIGLVTGIFEFLTGTKIIPYADPIENGILIILNAVCVMTGTFPLIKIVSMILKKPFGVLSKKMGINDTSAMGFLSTLATNLTTFSMTDSMDKKGIVLNSAFAISGAFVFAGHLAFTMAFNNVYILPVIVGKMVSGVTAVILASIIYNKFCNRK